MIPFATVRRMLATLLLAVWWGGFTFYALAVIPSGHEVLRSRVRQGFITRSVTEKLNWLGVVTLAVTLIELPAVRPNRRRFRLVLGAWLVCLAAQIALFYIHGLMDRGLDFTRMVVNDESSFYALHQCYLWAATIGWLGSGLMLVMPAYSEIPSGSEKTKQTEVTH